MYQFMKATTNLRNPSNLAELNTTKHKNNQTIEQIAVLRFYFTSANLSVIDLYIFFVPLNAA